MYSPKEDKTQMSSDEYVYLLLYCKFVIVMTYTPTTITTILENFRSSPSVQNNFRVGSRNPNVESYHLQIYSQSDQNTERVLMFNIQYKNLLFLSENTFFTQQTKYTNKQR